MPKLTERSETTDVTNGSFFHVAKSGGGGIFTSFKITIQNLKEALGINAKQDALSGTPEFISNKNLGGGYAGLDENGYVPGFLYNPTELFGVNTGDETQTSIKSKLGLSTGTVSVPFVNELIKEIVINNTVVNSSSKILLQLKMENGKDLDEIDFYKWSISYGKVIANTSFSVRISLDYKTTNNFKIDYQIIN